MDKPSIPAPGDDLAPHFPALYGLRGAAALWVLLFHWQVLSGDPHQVDGPFRWVARLGGAGVDVFFVLSAFLLTCTWLTASSPLSRADFWRRRAARILPAYWLQLLMLGGLLAVGTQPRLLSYTPDPLQWSAHAALYLQALPSIAPALGVWWSLPVEAAFYLTLPFFVPLLRRWPLGFVVIAIGVAIAWRGWLAHGDFEPMQRLYWSDTFPARLHEFALGMGAAWSWWRYRRNPRFIALPWRGIALTCAVLMFALPLLGHLSSEQRLFWGGSSGHPLFIAWHGYLALLSAGIVLALSQGVFAGVFAHRMIAYVGRISFGLYLWHVPVLLWVQQGWGGQAATSGSPYLFLLTVTTVSIAVAALSWHGLEEPILRRVRSTRVAE